jgi:hypothetical protein
MKMIVLHCYPVLLVAHHAAVLSLANNTMLMHFDISFWLFI